MCARDDMQSYMHRVQNVRTSCLCKGGEVQREAQRHGVRSSRAAGSRRVRVSELRDKVHVAMPARVTSTPAPSATLPNASAVAVM